MTQFRFTLISRVKDPYAMTFAFFKALTGNKTPEMMAEGMGDNIKKTSYTKPKKFQLSAAMQG